MYSNGSMSDSKWSDTRAKMDMALTGNGVPEEPQQTDAQSVSAVISDFSVKEIEPNIAEVYFEIEVPVGTETQEYIYTKDIEYGDKNIVTDVFEDGKNPIGKSVEINRDKGGGWQIDGEKISPKEHDPLLYRKKPETSLNVYSRCILHKTRSKLENGYISDFYVLESQTGIEQEYTIGLFIRLPNGTQRTLEVIHDKDHPSEVLCSIMNLNKSFSSQINKNVPVYYDSSDDTWYIYTGGKISNLYNTFMSLVGFEINPSEDDLVEFGRKYGQPRPTPLPKSVDDVDTSRVPDVLEI